MENFVYSFPNYTTKEYQFVTYISTIKHISMSTSRDNVMETSEHILKISRLSHFETHIKMFGFLLFPKKNMIWSANNEIRPINPFSYHFIGCFFHCSMTVKMTVYCNPNYYGRGCDIYCVPSSKYTCNRITGAKRCTSGWY